MPYAWQSETCIGDWHYNHSLYEAAGDYGRYLAPRDVIHWMVDTVSKNGTFILNIPGRPDGTIDSKEIAVLDGVTSWMQVNSEAIYETRPWKVYGEGPAPAAPARVGAFGGANSIRNLGPKNIRFTRNKANTVIYAHALGWPTEPMVIQALGSSAETKPGKVAKVELLGTGDKVTWKQAADALSVQLPKDYQPSVDYAAVLKITLT